MRAVLILVVASSLLLEACGCDDEDEALLSAARAGNVERLRAYIDGGGNPGFSCWTPSGSRLGSSRTLIDAVVESGSSDAVAVIAAKPPHTDRALHSALFRSQPGVAAMLAEKGAQFDLSRSERYLYFAFRIEDDETRLRQLRLLSKLGVNGNATGYRQETPLIGQLRELYLARSSLRREPDSAGIRAEEQRALSNIGFLFGLGVDLEVEDLEGETALMHALTDNTHDVAVRLIRKGANVNHENNRGRNLFSEVAAGRALIGVSTQIEWLGRLKKAGAEINVVDASGMTALDHALERAADPGTKQVVRVLERMGAKRAPKPLLVTSTRTGTTSSPEPSVK